MSKITVNILNEVAKAKGKSINKQNLQEELDLIDQDIILAEEEQNLVYEIWDKTSPINGVPAERFFERDDVDPNSEIYLIKDANTGNIIYFQPHLPEISGLVRMTKENVETEAKAHKSKIAQQKANNRVINQILSKF